MPAPSYLKLSLFFALTTSLAGWLLLGEVSVSETVDAPYCPYSFKAGLPERKPSPSTPPSRHEEQLFHPVEEMPLFPGCKIRGNYADQKVCADGLLLKFIHNNLSYPFPAWQDSVQGTAVVSFVVEKMAPYPTQG